MNEVVSEVESIVQIAEALFQAERLRLPIDPPTDRYPNLSLPDAYQIQRINIDKRVATGRKIVGHKIGLTAKAMQELFGVNEPDYGHLLDTMMHAENVPLNLRELVDPQIEIEPAFVLAKPLKGPDLTIEDVLEATDYISVCFEVIDSRIKDWRIKLPDTVADNGSSARVVMGSKKVKPDALQLEDLETVLRLDGQVVETGNTSAILGHPAYSVAWLANTLAQYGTVLQAGDVILPGTCTRSHRIAGCNNITGTIDGLGEVTLQLAGEPAVTANKKS